MQDFYKSFIFLISFSVVLVFFNMAFGEDATHKLLLLILASMLVFNVDKFKEIAKSLGNNEKE